MVVAPVAVEAPAAQAPLVTAKVSESRRPAADDRLTTIDGTSIVLADDEHLWRQYAVTRLKRSGQGEGTLYVTDLRVIFVARTSAKKTSRASTIVLQTKVDNVTGFGVHVSRTVSIFLVFVTIVLGLLGFLSLVVGQTAGIILLVFAAGGGLLIWRGSHRRGYVGLTIHSASSQPSPINFGEEETESPGLIRRSLRRVLGPILALIDAPTAYEVMYGVPADDAERVVSEFGALIIDLQTKGSLAADRWGVLLS